MVGGTSIVAFRIVSPLKYRIDFTNNTQETAYIKDVTVGNWNPPLSPSVPTFETATGMVFYRGI